MSYSGMNIAPPVAVEPMKCLKNVSDRFCVECGLAIRGQNKDRPNMCPHSACQKQLPFRQVKWDPDTFWGRCSACDSFMHRWFQYCQACGASNVEGQRRKRQLERAEREKEKFAIKQLRLENNQLRSWGTEQILKLQEFQLKFPEEFKRIEDEKKEAKEREEVEAKRLAEAARKEQEEEEIKKLQADEAEKQRFEEEEELSLLENLSQYEDQLKDDGYGKHGNNGNDM